MLTKENKKLMRDYLNSLPLDKERRGGTTYWFLPETDSEEWIAFVDDITCRVVTEVKVEEHPRFGPQINTYHASSFKVFSMLSEVRPASSLHGFGPHPRHPWAPVACFACCCPA